MGNILTDLSDGIRGLQRLNKELSEIELKEEILNLKQLLLAAKEDIMEKGEQLREVQARLSKRLETIEVSGFRYDVIDKKPLGLPYCPTCEVRDEKLYRLAKWSSTHSQCMNCKGMHNAGPNGYVNGDEEYPDFEPPAVY